MFQTTRSDVNVRAVVTYQATITSLFLLGGK
jgi:hypothetical protein